MNTRFAQRWSLWLLAPVAIALFGVFLWLRIGRIPRDPVYGGKALSDWLRAYAPSSPSQPHSREWDAADDAVRHIGTNSIPFLLHMIREKDSVLKLKMAALAQKQRFFKPHFILAAERNVEASRAFIVLGAAATCAVPALVKMYDQNISAQSQSAIMDALAWIGPAAWPSVPLLLRASTNADSRVRAGALWALGEIHVESKLCVPVLIRGLGDSNDWTRLSAAHALGQFGTEARSAVPALTDLTNIRSGFRSFRTLGIQVTLEARKALLKIDPQPASPSDENVPALGLPPADLRTPAP